MITRTMVSPPTGPKEKSFACQRRSSVERAISAYYDSLSDEEKREQEAWGEFAVAQFTQDPK